MWQFIEVPRKVRQVSLITIGMGDQMWQGGTNYGAIDGPAGPTKASQSATSGPGGPTAAAITGPGGLADYGGTGCRMTSHPPLFPYFRIVLDFSTPITFEFVSLLFVARLLIIPAPTSFQIFNN